MIQNSEQTGSEDVLRLSGVTKEFRLGGTFRKTKHIAVKNASLTVGRNQILGLVGESGSGKSTLGRIAIGLIKPTSGSVSVLGQDIFAMKPQALRLYRRKMQMIFQDSSNSLNPRMTLQELLEEPYRVQNLYSPADRHQRARALADEVQLAESWLGRLPHEFSGGQARVLNLLKDIQEARNLSMIFVSHDMAVVEFMSDQVAVLYQGEIVESGPAVEVFGQPSKPYTQVLLESTPSL
jgi:peptide/nickel transport system ATP-binding protein